GRARAQRRPRGCPLHRPHGNPRVRHERRSARASRPRSRIDRRHDPHMYPHEVLHWIDDEECAGAGTTEAFEKRSPSDDHVLGSVRRGTAADVAKAVDCAAAAADAWARTPAPKRGEILGRAGALLSMKEREFAEIIQAETGKPWKYATAEVASSADLAAFMDGEGSRLYGKTTTSPIPNRSVRTVRAPIGVCAAVMPFNSPLAGIAWKAFPALVCGNAVVAKS